jgi:hypothetical protein
MSAPIRLKLKLKQIYPINYDFGKNWDTKIKPFLDHPKIKRSITKGINSYLRDNDFNKLYKKGTAPASYSSRDGYFMVMDRKRETKRHELYNPNQLPDDDDEQSLMEMEKEIDFYFPWDQIKYDIETYDVIGACHWWAPTFEITLARLVEPTESWRILSSSKHTTVINHDSTKIFDLLYWCGVGGRLNYHLFGDQLNDNDLTLGGKLAFIDASRED